MHTANVVILFLNFWVEYLFKSAIFVAVKSLTYAILLCTETFLIALSEKVVGDHEIILLLFEVFVIENSV